MKALFSLREGHFSLRWIRGILVVSRKVLPDLFREAYRGAVSSSVGVLFFFPKYNVGYPQRERVAHVVFDVRRSGRT